MVENSHTICASQSIALQLDRWPLWGPYNTRPIHWPSGAVLDRNHRDVELWPFTPLHRQEPPLRAISQPATVEYKLLSPIVSLPLPFAPSLIPTAPSSCNCINVDIRLAAFEIVLTLLWSRKSGEWAEGGPFRDIFRVIRLRRSCWS